MGRPKKELLFLISTFLSAIAIIVLWYTPVMSILHEAGHGYMYYILTGNKCDYARHEIENKTTYETLCSNKGVSSFQHNLVLYSGFGFTILIGLLLIFTPLSIIGGVMQVITAYTLVFAEQKDLVNAPRWMIILIAAILLLVWIVSIHIQVKWLEYFIRKIKRFKQK